MTIEPKESESGADERSANHREFTGEWIERDLQILRDFEITGGVGQESIGQRDRYGATDGETIEAISQVNSVRRTNDHHRKKNQREPTHIGDHGNFEERQIKRARLDLQHGAGQKNDDNDSCEQQLRGQPNSAWDAIRFFLRDFAVVVEKSEDVEV